MPNNGAFFVNYVITSAFIGSAAELVRVPELLLYAIKLACARSAAERTSVRKVSLHLHILNLPVTHSLLNQLLYPSVHDVYISPYHSMS